MKRPSQFARSLSFVGLTAALVAASSPGIRVEAGFAPAPAAKPNIILIVADDLGYADLGVQGCKDIPTPNIDSIAAAGVRFTSGYVTCPVCSPTRAGLMTGRYQERFGHEFNPGPRAMADADFGLPLTEVTIANRLKSLGYATGMFGKWHLGYKPELNPIKRGFDEFFGFLGGAHSYVNSGGANPILRGTAPVDESSYLTEAFTREAVSFIERHPKEPFFVYLPFNAVHAPLEAIEKYLARFGSITNAKRRTFAAMLSALDDGVGRVLAKLRELKIEESTLIFFISDNGGPTQQTSSRNDPLRGYKGQVWEGGIRIPFLIQWKGQLRSGRVYNQPAISLDVLPTAVAAAGGKTDAKLDGVNLLPFLSGENKTAPHGRLYWRFGDQSAIRAGDWKMVKMAGSPALFNLAEDIPEKNDLASKQPEKLKELQAAWDSWNEQMTKAKWVRNGRRRR